MDDKDFKDEIVAQAKRVNEYFPANITEEDKERTRTNREISNANLIPVKPGEIRNPSGRPKDKKYISEALKELLAKEPELLREVVLAIVKQAKIGNVQAFKELTDRTEGKVADKIEGTENPVTIILKPARDRE